LTASTSVLVAGLLLNKMAKKGLLNSGPFCFLHKAFFD
jgi:hypothetical protein